MTAGKTEIAAKVATRLGVNRQTAMEYVSAVMEAQARTLVEHGEVTIRGFGTFRIKEVGESRARNPRTGAVVAVPPHKRVRFRAGKMFRDIVSGRR
ncbi:MAG: HU family DNA-binding protein [Dehalococcoidia bacterium]|nr:HU family DNA-binding protein [Dehalococcoidia bacterium]